MDINLVQEVNQLHANICAALADPSRILILYFLSEGPNNVNAIVDAIELPQPTVSRHLKILRERGLVNTERDGQSIIYELADARVIQALDLMRSILTKRLNTQAALVNKINGQ